MIFRTVPWKVEVRLNAGGKLTYYRSGTDSLEIDDNHEVWVWDEKESPPRQISGVRKSQPITNVQQSLW